MPKGPFHASEFVATKFSTGADKADFGNMLLHFLDADCARPLFTKKFYQWLSNTFSHIAEYDLHGFYEVWFYSDAERLEFVRHLLRDPCHGQPEYTFSDVERAIQREVIARDFLARYERKAAEAMRSVEVAQLERLEAKYRTSSLPEHPPVTTLETAPADLRAEPPIEADRAMAVQMQLF